MTTLTTGVLGVNVNRVTDGTTTNGQNAEFKLGTEVVGADGNTYRYVQAGAALSTTTTNPIALAIDENEQAVALTGALALAGHRIGFLPQQIVADNAFFWARMKGVFPIRVATGAVAADVALGLPSTTDGRLAAAPTTASATNAVVLGVTITTAGATASASAGDTIRTAIVTGPLGKRPTL